MPHITIRYELSHAVWRDWTPEEIAAVGGLKGVILATLSGDLTRIPDIVDNFNGEIIEVTEE